MVNPGALSFAIIRGIAFEWPGGIVLQCRDEKINVTALWPGVAGQYVPCGTFSGYDLFILPAAASSFIYFNPVAASYVIAETLTTGALTDYWLPSSPLLEPSGTYIGQGSLIGIVAANDNPTDLTGYAAEATVRRSEKPGAEIVLDLNPSVTNAPIGEVTIPGISKADTFLLKYIGDFRWDFVLRLISTGERFGPFARGQFVISDNITQPQLV